MYGIPKEKRKTTPQAAINIVAQHGGVITHQEAEIVLEMMYDFAKLALNQQLQIRTEGQDQPISRPGPE